MQTHKIVSEQEWLVARKDLLVQEKALSKARDRLTAARRGLPWVKVEKTYVFDGPSGKETLAALFAGRSQLIVYHFMFAPGVPGWPSAGCPMCSFLSDHIDSTLPHLEHHDVSLVVVSHAPLANLERYRKRMDWHFKWFSCDGNDFGRDYRVSFTKEDIASGNTMYNYEIGGKTHEGEAPGISVFFKDENGDIFRTYSSYARGGDLLIGTYNYLDPTPQGRNEKDEHKGWVPFRSIPCEIGLVVQFARASSLRIPTLGHCCGHCEYLYGSQPAQPESGLRATFVATRRQ